jgi:hypothetical protein
MKIVIFPHQEIRIPDWDTFLTEAQGPPPRTVYWRLFPDIVPPNKAVVRVVFMLDDYATGKVKTWEDRDADAQEAIRRTNRRLRELSQRQIPTEQGRPALAA